MQEVEVLTLLRQILELGWPAIVLLQLWFLWNENRKLRATDRAAYDSLMREYIEALREIAGLRANLPTLSNPPQRPPTLPESGTGPGKLG